MLALVKTYLWVVWLELETEFLWDFVKENWRGRKLGASDGICVGFFVGVAEGNLYLGFQLENLMVSYWVVLYKPPKTNLYWVFHLGNLRVL